MNRVATLNLQFAENKPTTTQSANQKNAKIQGNFQDTWSYLSMDQFLTKEGIEYRKKCEEFA